MTQFNAPEGITGISVCGTEFKIEGGLIDIQDPNGDVVNALLLAGCTVFIPTEETVEGVDAKSEKLRVRGQLDELGIKYDARSRLATLQALLIG